MRALYSVLVALGLGIATAAQGLWEQCRSEDGTEVACGKGMVCVPDIEYYDLCYLKVVDLADQCGGLGWNVSCVNGTTCERQNEGWATCEDIDEVLGQAALWQQCNLSNSNACAEDLVCVDDSDYHGLCVRKVNARWGQCSGAGWRMECEIGSSCEAKTATYSRCIPDVVKDDPDARINGYSES